MRTRKKGADEVYDGPPATTTTSSVEVVNGGQTAGALRSDCSRPPGDATQIPCRPGSMCKASRKYIAATIQAAYDHKLHQILTDAEAMGTLLTVSRHSRCWCWR